MILSVSRRTDIPAFYTEWLMNRLNEGYVYIKNPMNANQISKVEINPNVVDCIVFWSKNPKPLISKLEEIDAMGYKYYFQFTITPYDNAIERSLPDKSEILETFKLLSNKIGKDKVIWRYDPIILNDRLNINYHIESFERIISELSGYTDECIISFVDPYNKTKRNMGNDFIRLITKEEMNNIAEEIAKIASKYKVRIKTCAEAIELEKYGIEHASCIDRTKIENIIHCPLSDKLKKDDQRENCGCIQCIDVGAYNTCKNNCLYCYATFNQDEVIKNSKLHNPKSALLIGESSNIKKISERKVNSFKDNQIRLI